MHFIQFKFILYEFWEGLKQCDIVFQRDLEESEFSDVGLARRKPESHIKTSNN